MFFRRLMTPGPAKTAGRRLYAAIVARARDPDLYARLGAPDTPDGRFEVYSLHVLLALERLRGEGGAGSAVGQALFDAYLTGLDHGLRELAVGDLAVGRTMKKLAGAFYGRGKALDEALAALPDRSPLEALLSRTVFAGDPDRDPAPLAEHVLRLRGDLAAIAPERLLAGELDLAMAQ